MPSHRFSRLPLNLVLLLGIAFLLLPIVLVVVQSFNASAFGIWPPSGFSTRWYGSVFHGGGFGQPTIRSVVLALVATAVALVVGCLAALALTRYRFWGRRLVEGYVLGPLIVPKVAIGIAAFILFLRLDVYGSFVSVVLVHVVVVLPFVVTLCVAGLLRVDRTVEEAAADLGAPPLRVMWSATLPQMRGALAAAAAFAFVISFDELDATVFVVGQTSNTLPVAMFLYLQKFASPTLAALSTLLIAASLLVALVVGITLSRIGGMRVLTRTTDAARAADVAEAG
jgi:ABC-type spermidine/putrescine transport system permease subunit II